MLISARGGDFLRRMALKPMDVIVIGGGVGGLLAARRLAEGGARVIVFEANRRIGGRMQGIDAPTGRVPLGARYVAAHHQVLLGLIAELGVSLVEHVDSACAVPERLFLGGRQAGEAARWRLAAEFERSLGLLARRAGRPSAGTGQRVEDWLRSKGLSRAAAALFQDAGPGTMSLPALLAMLRAAPDVSGFERFRIKDPMQVVERLAGGGFPVATGEPVTGLWRSGGVLCVALRGGLLVRAPNVVVALPHTSLPMLLPAVARSIPGLRMVQVRLVAWRSPDARPGQLALSDGAVRACWAEQLDAGTYVYAMIPEGSALTSAPVAKLRNEVLQMLSPEVHLDERGFELDWRRRCGGTWPQWAPGPLPPTPPSETPMSGVHLVGDYIEPGFTGYMEGSLRSAVRAAGRILDAHPPPG